MVLFIIDERHSVRIAHIRYFRKKQEIVYFVLWRFLRPITLSFRTIFLDSVSLLLKNIFKKILVVKLNPQSRELTQRKLD